MLFATIHEKNGFFELFDKIQSGFIRNCTNNILQEEHASKSSSYTRYYVQGNTKAEVIKNILNISTNTKHKSSLIEIQNELLAK